jgi:prepilin-type processing-associated H-X9-DG protein
MGGSGGLVRWNVSIYQDGPGINHASGNWGSCHPNGSFFLFADGHVQTLRYTTPGGVVGALMTYNGQEPVDPSMY